MAFGDQKTDPQAELKRFVAAKVEKARTERQDRAAFLNETYRLGMPWRRRIGQKSRNAPKMSEEDVADMVDSTLAETIEDFASDMIAQFTPENEPWVRMRVKGSVGAGFGGEAEQMAINTEAAIFDALSESSYYDAAHQCFTDLGNGTMAARARRPRRGGDPFEFEAIEPADLLLLQSPSRGVADCRFTEASITVRDYYALYGAFAPLPDSLRMSGMDTEIDVVDGFYRAWENPRGDRAWRRCILVNSQLVYERFVSDDDDVDIFVARWKVDGRSGWGVGSAWRACPPQRALNELVALGLVAIGKYVDSPFFYTDDGVVNLEQGFEAGDAVPVSQQFELHQWEPKGNFDVKFFTEQDLRQVIRRAMFQDKPEQMGKTPPTAEQWQSLEVRSEQRWEIPRGKLVREWVLPITLWTKKALEQMGMLGPYVIDRRAYQIVPNSPFAKARSQEKVVRAQQILGTFANYSPETFPVDVDVSATMENVKREMRDELVMIRPKEEREAILKQVAAAQAGGGGAG